MKIVIISDWFSENMGYIENCLPKALVDMGHEVHVVTTQAQVYYNSPFYNKTYFSLLGDPVLPVSSKLTHDGFHLHRLGLGTFYQRIYLRGLHSLLAEIKPDIVQTFDAASLSALQCAWERFRLGFNLFTGNHIVASVYPIALEKKKATLSYLIRRVKLLIRDTIWGKIVATQTTLSYPATVDAEDISIRFLGVPKHKNKIMYLGVDASRFGPVSSAESAAERLQMRERFGVNQNDILCVYTGRFTTEKNPLCLAQAIQILCNRNEPFKALFIGEGPQSEEIAKIPNCQIIPFMKNEELPRYYRSCDIGVWPRQESTSVLDATACGLPVIISDRVQAIERKEGNGIVYEENCCESLANAIMSLKDEAVRQTLSEAGIHKIKTKLSWEAIAKLRLADYQVAVDRKVRN